MLNCSQSACDTRVWYICQVDAVLLLMSGTSQTRHAVIVPAVSETTKRSFYHSSAAGSAASPDQHDTARPVSAVIRFVLHAFLYPYVGILHDVL